MMSWAFCWIYITVLILSYFIGMRVMFHMLRYMKEKSPGTQSFVREGKLAKHRR